MGAIYKYILNININTTKQIISLPDGANILTFQMQDNTPTIWCMVDPNAILIPRTFRIFGTGWSIPDDELENLYYLGTVQDGCFVWHLFEEMI